MNTLLLDQGQRSITTFLVALLLWSFTLIITNLLLGSLSFITNLLLGTFSFITKLLIDLLQLVVDVTKVILRSIWVLMKILSCWNCHFSHTYFSQFGCFLKYPKWMVYNGEPYYNWMIWGYNCFRKDPIFDMSAKTCSAPSLP